MTKYKNIYDTKFVVLDLSFNNIQNTNIDQHISINKIFKKVSASQNLIIVTDDSIGQVTSCIDNWDLKSGFIVSNLGACIYNIATKDVVESTTLNPELLLTILKQAIWNNLNFVLNTIDTSYVYRINQWLISKSKFDLTKLYKLYNKSLNSWTQTKETVFSNEILNIEIIFHENDYAERKIRIKKFIAACLPLCDFNYTSKDNMLFIYPSNVSKLITAQNLASKKNVDYSFNSLYLAIHQLCPDLIANSYISVACSEALNDQTPTPAVTEILPAGNDSWYEWLNNHEYLWNEPVKAQYKALLQFAIFESLKPIEKKQLDDGKYKYLSLNVKYKEIYIGYPVHHDETNWFKKYTKKENNQEIKKIFLWTHSADIIFNLLSNKRSSYQ